MHFSLVRTLFEIHPKCLIWIFAFSLIFKHRDQLYGKSFHSMPKKIHRFNESWPIWLAPMVIICFLVCLLHLLDRQVELSIRSDFLWQYKLSSEEEGVDTMRGINKILLENILPAHVAEHYLLRGQGMSGILQDNVIIQKKV